MPIPDINSMMKIVMYCGNTTIGSSLISPIPSGSGNTLTVGSGLIEISPTSGNVYCITYVTTGLSAFTLTENGSVLSYTHGSTKLLQDPNYY